MTAWRFTTITHAYATRPGDLPDVATVTKGLTQAGNDLMALRASPNVPDYTGPVLFDAPAADSVLAQLLPASISGARPPLSMVARFDQMMQSMGGRTEWSGRVGTRVLPADVTLIDDPTMKDFKGQPLLGAYDVDDDGVKAEKVVLVDNGVLKNLLMSRRPGPDFTSSNGHARSAQLSDTQPLSSNLILQSSAALNSADLKKKFLDACKQDGQQWCIEVKRMDNPALSSVRSQDFADFIGEVAGGITSGLRVPLLVYRVYVDDGHEELVRGGTLQGLDAALAAQFTGGGRRCYAVHVHANSRERFRRNRARRIRLRAGWHSQHDNRPVSAARRRGNPRLPRRTPPPAAGSSPTAEMTIR